MFSYSVSEISDEILGRISGISYRENSHISLSQLRYITLAHHGIDGREHIGELIVNEAIADDIIYIFGELYDAKYPIEKLRLVDEYSGDDVRSMADNNSSAFNYRVIAGTDTLSRHALGMAIDVNPLYNPYITFLPDGAEHCSPPQGLPYADRRRDFPMKIDENDLCFKLFTERGFEWGGNWSHAKDYQHFEK